MTTKSIAERVRALRVVRGLTQDGLAAAAGLTRAHVSLIERGERTQITPDTLRGLADALSVSIDWLITGDKETR